MIPVHKKIEIMRKNKNVSKASVARSLGISAMGYHYLECGRTPISTDRLQIISTVLGVSPIVFLSLELNEMFTCNALQYT